MTLEKLIAQIDKKGYINYKEFMIEAVKGNYYKLLTDNQEIICALIDEHNAKLEIKPSEQTI